MSSTPAPPSPQDSLDLPDLDTVLANLELAAVDAIETQDFLLYLTLLDIYLNDPLAYTPHERGQLVDKLYEVLTVPGRDSLVYEIGWDIPLVVLPLLDCEISTEDGIRRIPPVAGIMRLFNLLLREGNPKELCLRACELLTSTRDVPRNPVTGESYPSHQSIYLIKFHVLAELMRLLMVRTVTAYPSRFLLMTANAFLAALAYALANVTGSSHIMLRRIYVFARDYVGPQVPEGESLSDDELYLQRKLLAYLVTKTMDAWGQHTLMGWTQKLYKTLTEQGKRAPVPSYPLTMPPPGGNQVGLADIPDLGSTLTGSAHHDQVLVDRFVELAISIDIDLVDEFDKEILVGRQLQLRLELAVALAAGSTPRETLQEQFALLVAASHHLEVAAASKTSIPILVPGMLMLYGGEMLCYTPVRNGELPPAISLRLDISVLDVMLLAIRHMLAPRIDRNYRENKGAADVIGCVAVLRILGAKPNDLVPPSAGALAEVYLMVVKTYLQLILTETCVNVEMLAPLLVLRMVYFTTITKVLTLAQPHTSFEFIVDLLQSCPFPNGKVALVGVLRDLCLKDRAFTVDAVTAQMADASVEAAPPRAAPAPPPRLTKYIPLTPERQEMLREVASLAIDRAFAGDAVDVLAAQEVLAYVNMFVAVRGLMDTEVDALVARAATGALLSEDPVAGMVALAATRYSERWA